MRQGTLVRKFFKNILHSSVALQHTACWWLSHFWQYKLMQQQQGMFQISLKSDYATTKTLGLNFLYNFHHFRFIGRYKYRHYLYEHWQEAKLSLG